jgi:hypothetical protein
LHSGFNLIKNYYSTKFNQIKHKYSYALYFQSQLRQIANNFDLVGFMPEDSLILGYQLNNKRSEKLCCLTLSDLQIKWTVDIFNFNNFQAIHMLSDDSTLVIISENVYGVNIKMGKKLWDLKSGKKDIKVGFTSNDVNKFQTRRINEGTIISKYKKDTNIVWQILRDDDGFYLASVNSLIKVSNQGRIICEQPNCTKRYSNSTIYLKGDTLIQLLNHNLVKTKTIISYRNKKTGDLFSETEYPASYGWLEDFIFNDTSYYLLFKGAIVEKKYDTHDSKKRH